ncbi:uncharacterized protein LOC121051109 isoform X2 [Rosa chinensis]|uniref:uncharacterized protein LOC121051109 isoform X2 n=1 Tax=Rosa chinensis TaxID=74649 RepID=UPI001AD937F8|nr:uncharacterized protein LOC121051109 isoform X2 [Rosa chinensis]
MSRNYFSSWRDGFTRTSQCSAVGNYYEEQFGKFERSGLKPRCPDHRATPHFQAWWSTFIMKNLGKDLAGTQRAALQGLPNLPGPKEGNGKKKAPDGKLKSTKGSSKQGQTSKKRGSTLGYTWNAKKTKKSSDVLENSVTNPTDTMVSEDIFFEANMDDGHDALAENQNTSEIEDMAETGDASIHSADSADSEGYSEEAQSESGDQERDGRIDHSLPPLENSMIEIDMDNLGESQLHNTSSIGQQLAISNNFSKDVENTDARGRETLLIHQTLVQDHTAGDLGLDLLQFLNTLDNTTSPEEEKLETAETKKALETVIQFLGCDVRTVTEASFLSFKEAVEVLISAKHFSQVEAYEVHARLAVVNFSLSPCLEAQKEFEAGEKLKSEYDDIRQSTDLGQLQKLKTSLDEGRQKVLDLRKQLAEAEKQVKVTSAAIRTIVPQQDLTKYSLILSSVKSYNKKRGILKRKVDQGMQDLEDVKEALRSLLPTD